MTPSVYVTYNPKSELEQTLALRLYTIGAVSGFRMFLPDRRLKNLVDPETAYKILEAQWFICFSTRPLSREVQNEMEFAYSRRFHQNKSRIILVYDERVGKNLVNTEFCTEFMFNPVTQGTDGVLNAILKHISGVEANALQGRTPATAENNSKALAALLGIGLGFLALGSLAGDEEPEKPKKSTRRPSSSSSRSGASTKKPTVASKSAKPSSRKGGKSK